MDVIRSIRKKKNISAMYGSVEYLREVGIDKLTRRELRDHLESRDLPTLGTRQELIERLTLAVEEEELAARAFTNTIDAETMKLIELEESGSVYGIGLNEEGQLGLGDLTNRDIFTAIRPTCGLCVKKLVSGDNITFALTEASDVYVWGGGRSAPSGIPTSSAIVSGFMHPQRVPELCGQEVTNVAVGSRHALACTSGGDLYVWGVNDVGQLGFGDFKTRNLISLNDNMPVTSKCVSCGHNYSLMLAMIKQDVKQSINEVYSWGHVSCGKLGTGSHERHGVDAKERLYFPSPSPLVGLRSVVQICCGTDHVLAKTASSCLYSWGCGAGGKLGHGDVIDRWEPTVISSLINKTIIDVTCNKWHSAAIILVPPLTTGGYVFTWGSGFYGQLGQGRVLTSMLPKRVDCLSLKQVLAMKIFSGPYHNFIIATDGELWSWGSNKYYCLGRDIDELDVDFSADVGHVGGFGVIVNQVGRGMPRDVSCGIHFSLVSTWPYQGPSLEVSMKLTEERALEKERERIKKLSEGKLDDDDKHEIQDEDVDGNLCVVCEECPGYSIDHLHPLICQACGHTAKYHTLKIVRVNDDDDDIDHGSAVDQASNPLENKFQSPKTRIGRASKQAK